MIFYSFCNRTKASNSKTDCITHLLRLVRLCLHAFCSLNSSVLEDEQHVEEKVFQKTLERETE